MKLTHTAWPDYLASGLQVCVSCECCAGYTGLLISVINNYSSRFVSVRALGLVLSYLEKRIGRESQRRWRRRRRRQRVPLIDNTICARLFFPSSHHRRHHSYLGTASDTQANTHHVPSEASQQKRRKRKTQRTHRFMEWKPYFTCFGQKIKDRKYIRCMVLAFARQAG